MKKIQYLLVMLMALVLTASCSSDDNQATPMPFTVQLTTSDNSVSDFSNFTVKLTELKSNTPFTAKADNSGKAVFNDIPQGQYNIVAEDDINGASTMYGSKLNFTYSSEVSSLQLEVKSIMNSLDKTFVLDELYFNQDVDVNGTPSSYENYLTIRNVSDRALYADGLCIVLAGMYNNVEEEADGPMQSYLAKDSIVVGQVYQIPGDGHTYKVEPGQSLVIARQAINHKLGEDGKVDANKPYSIDLTGADFEIYVTYNGTNVVPENPDVPNLKVIHSVQASFEWPLGGHLPIMLARLDDATIKKMQDGIVSLSRPGWDFMKLQYMIMPVSAVIDGVETGDVDWMSQKSLPAIIDKSSILVTNGDSGGGQFISRKVITDANGKQTVQDTNDSANDFEIKVHGQKSYPKK